MATLANAQEILTKLQQSVSNFEADAQMKSGMLGLYVISQQTGAVVFEKNANTGMPVASSQKVITSVASLEMLGTSYRYQTSLAYNGSIKNGVLNGNLCIIGAGDPTLGSWRYDYTKEQFVLNKWIKAIKEAGITHINGAVKVGQNNWQSQTIPGGWIWDDIGNYYGAGATVLNWHENQYDLELKSRSKTGDSVQLIATVPFLFDVNFVNELTTGLPGSGDNAYIYLPPYSHTGYLRGTIPPNKNPFTIAGSFPDPIQQLVKTLAAELEKQGIRFNVIKSEVVSNLLPKILLTLQSPPLDSINYWFLRKSINLYGEALARTIGYEKKKQPTTQVGISLIKDFWKERGVEPASSNMFDGSGLSPQTRITPQALVKVMQYAKSQSYFNSFYSALPEFNGIKMKSGTIGGVKSFTGYVNGYTFAIVVNNYNGSAIEIVRKMYKLLDILT
ncbi:MAG: D-alanyl-D-alanine carboxypeptidase/D-alanyl-D-alanine-endopeptidase [Chitinophagaceae bacterium]